MNSSPSARAALLLQQHANGAPFAPFCDELALNSVDEAYAVQEAYVAGLCQQGGREVVGWKIGLTSPRMQALLGIDSPIAGAVLSGRVHDSGHIVAREAFGRLGIECEIAVRLGRSLPAAGAPYDFAAVSDAVEAVCPAIEIVDDREADYALTDIGSLVADNCWNAGVVLGEFIDSWPALAEVTGVVYRDATEIDRGSGRDVLGHPFEPLLWLANHLAARGQALEQGMIVSTGSLATTRFPTAPEHYRFVIAGLGEVNLGVS